MMLAKTEQKSLKYEPLPEEEIKDPLSYVFECDKQIADLNERIEDLNRLRKDALDYAVKHGVEEDAGCKLKTSIRTDRTLNLERFKEVFKKEYETVCDIEREEIRKSLDHIGENVNLGLLDQIVGKTALSAAPGVISINEKKSYKVVKKVKKDD